MLSSSTISAVKNHNLANNVSRDLPNTDHFVTMLVDDKKGENEGYAGVLLVCQTSPSPGPSNYLDSFAKRVQVPD